MDAIKPFAIAADQAGATLAALLGSRLRRASPWNQVRRLIETRQARVDGELCLESPPAGSRKAKRSSCWPVPLPGRTSWRVLWSATSTATSWSSRSPRACQRCVIRWNAPGMRTARPCRRRWKTSSPSSSRSEGQRKSGTLPAPPAFVQRLDKETSGLVVFARSVVAERGLGRQFHDHTVIRRYLAVVPGFVPPQRIQTWLIRDRGDGRRGSGDSKVEGKTAITHVDVVERLSGYTLLACRLETGRTHQIRIHLAELGHPVCGDKVYCQRRDGTTLSDQSGAPRLALHATELGFRHPVTHQELHWTMPLPLDLEAFLDRLRARTTDHADRNSMDG